MDARHHRRSRGSLARRTLLPLAAWVGLLIVGVAALVYMDVSRAGAPEILVPLGGLALLLTALVFHLVLRHHVSRPLEGLARATEALARGELDAPLPVDRGDELGRLAAALERMREAVASKTDALESEEQARLESERLLRAILDQTPAVVFIKDIEGRYELVNRRFRELIGPRAEGAGPLTDHDFLPPEAADAMRENDARVIEGGVPIQFEERVPIDGSEHIYVTVKFPIYDTDGTPLGVGGIATDITQRKELEEQLRQSQKMDALGQLAGGVAHDFNNLLTVILAQSDLIRASLADQPALRGDIELVLDAAERARALTRQLLAFSRRELYDAQIFDLRDALGEMRALLSRVIAENIEVEVELGDRPLTVRADRGQIEQVTLNLATNARDAMPDGGRLRLAAAEVELGEDEELGAAPGRYARLTVSDTGVGMDEATRAKAMEPFFTTKTGDRGTGLGLSIVYGVVKQSGGVMHIRSAPGEGTTVEVYLPVAEGVSAPSPAVDTESHAGAETVLVLEDSPQVGNVIRRALESRGYSVLMATRGEDAVALARAHPGEIDLFVSDVMLPGMDGPSAAAEVRALRPDIAVLFVTGHVDQEIRAASLGEDADVLEKPFRPAELVRRVRRALDREP